MAMTPSNRMAASVDHRLTLTSEDGAVAFSFDLNAVPMSTEQQAIVAKLFAQHPVAEVTTEEHSAAAERGAEGPGARYLSPEEFESIRALGVRLGTSGELAAAQCDFCLHCVKLEPLPEWNAGIR